METAVLENTHPSLEHAVGDWGYQEKLSGKDKTQSPLKVRHLWSGEEKGVLQEREQHGQRQRGM